MFHPRSWIARFTVPCLAACLVSVALPQAGACPDCAEHNPKPDPSPRFLRTPVTLAFPQVILDDVVYFLRDITGANFVSTAAVMELAGEDGLSLSLNVSSLSLDKALSLICLAAHPRLTWSLGPGDVVKFDVLDEILPLAERRDLPGIDEEADGALYQTLWERNLDLSFQGAAFPEVLDFLRDVLEVNIVSTARAQRFLADQEPSVSLRLHSVAAPNVLDILCDMTEGLTWKTTRGAIVIDADYWPGEQGEAGDDGEAGSEGR